jgi:hypothetical protein
MSRCGPDDEYCRYIRHVQNPASNPRRNNRISAHTLVGLECVTQTRQSISRLGTGQVQAFWSPEGNSRAETGTESNAQWPVRFPSGVIDANRIT